MAYFLRRNGRQRADAEANMQRMEEALERSQKLEAIGKLTGGVAHDFNNILQILNSNVQVLNMSAMANPPVEHHLRSISAAIERGPKPASRLLTFARRQALHPTTVELERLIKNIDTLIQQLLGQDIQLQISIADTLWPVKVDPGLLENVVLNLAANARDAMNGSGTSSITLSNALIDEYGEAPANLPGEYVKLLITDTGSGMLPEVLEHVFEPFFTTKPEGKGTGLGLSMANGFIKESGRHIHIESEPDSGTTVRIHLPPATSAQPLSSSRLFSLHSILSCALWCNNCPGGRR